MKRRKFSNCSCIQTKEILSKAIEVFKGFKRKISTEQTPKKLAKTEHRVASETESQSVSTSSPREGFHKNYPLVADQYKLEREIGRGGSAVVYSAQCVLFNEMVAIKCLDLEKSNAELTRLEHEVRTLRLLSHPNILSAHCAFIVNTRLWEVLPFMAAGSFQTILNTTYPKGMEEAVIATVLKETLKALAYLHNEGHIHRDVKAANILLDNDGSVKLADFGVAAFIYESGDREKMRRHTFSGTLFWMAPEVVFSDDCNEGYDCKADIWSFGITAIELAYGHPPFYELTTTENFTGLGCSATPQLTDPKFSRSFKEMVNMCLVRDPHERPTAEKLLKHSFFKNHGKPPEYIVKHLLPGLRSLSNGMRALEENCKHFEDKALVELFTPAPCHRLEDEEEGNRHE